MATERQRTLGPKQFAIQPRVYVADEIADQFEAEAIGYLVYLAKHKQLLTGCFDDEYQVYYHTVLYGRGKQLHDWVIAVLKGLSLREPPVLYFKTAGMIASVCMFLNNTWMVTNQKPPISQTAKALYERPVARRWRRVIWFLRVQRWRLAFDEVAFAPGQGGAVHTAAHFQACVDVQQSGSATCAME